MSCLLYVVWMGILLLFVMLQGHNAFIRKNLNHTTFSAEAGNLYNKHSYKHSGAWQQRAAVSSSRQHAAAAVDNNHTAYLGRYQLSGYWHTFPLRSRAQQFQQLHQDAVFSARAFSVSKAPSSGEPCFALLQLQFQ
jgi:hypothetical protein